MLLGKIRYTGCTFGEYAANNTPLYGTRSIILYLLYFQEEVIVEVTFLVISITGFVFFFSWCLVQIFLLLSICLCLFFPLISIYTVNILMFKYTL